MGALSKLRGLVESRTTTKFTKGKLIIFIDASGSMSTMHAGMSRFDRAKKYLSEMLKNIVKERNFIVTEVHIFLFDSAVTPFISLTNEAREVFDDIAFEFGLQIVTTAEKRIRTMPTPKFGLTAFLPVLKQAIDTCGGSGKGPTRGKGGKSTAPTENLTFIVTDGESDEHLQKEADELSRLSKIYNIAIVTNKPEMRLIDGEITGELVPPSEYQLSKYMKTEGCVLSRDNVSDENSNGVTHLDKYDKDLRICGLKFSEDKESVQRLLDEVLTRTMRDREFTIADQSELIDVCAQLSRTSAVVNPRMTTFYQEFDRCARHSEHFLAPMREKLIRKFADNRCRMGYKADPAADIEMINRSITDIIWCAFSNNFVTLGGVSKAYSDADYTSGFAFNAQMTKQNQEFLSNGCPFVRNGEATCDLISFHPGSALIINIPKGTPIRYPSHGLSMDGKPFNCPNSSLTLTDESILIPQVYNDASLEQTCRVWVRTMISTRYMFTQAPDTRFNHYFDCKSNEIIALIFSMFLIFEDNDYGKIFAELLHVMMRKNITEAGVRLPDTYLSELQRGAEVPRGCSIFQTVRENPFVKEFFPVPSHAVCTFLKALKIPKKTFPDYDIQKEDIVKVQPMWAQKSHVFTFPIMDIDNMTHPRHMVCSITHCLIERIAMCCGRAYEDSAIRKCLTMRGVNPLTNEPCRLTDIHRNSDLQDELDVYRRSITRPAHAFDDMFCEIDTLIEAQLEFNHPHCRILPQEKQIEMHKKYVVRVAVAARHTDCAAAAPTTNPRPSQRVRNVHPVSAIDPRLTRAGRFVSRRQFMKNVDAIEATFGEGSKYHGLTSLRKAYQKYMADMKALGFK